MIRGGGQIPKTESVHHGGHCAPWGTSTQSRRCYGEESAGALLLRSTRTTPNHPFPSHFEPESGSEDPSEFPK